MRTSISNVRIRKIHNNTKEGEDREEKLLTIQLAV